MLTRTESALRIAMYLAYISLCVAALAVLVPAFRSWLTYEAELADYHLAVLRWRLGSKPAPGWTAELERDDLPPEEAKPDGPERPAGGV